MSRKGVTTSNPVGRPIVHNIEPGKVERLAYLGASLRDIGYVFGCDHKTILDRFATEYHAGQAKRRNRLRAWQWKSAKAGNVTMQIWLGKNELDQSDSQKIEHDGGVKVEVVYRSTAAVENSNN